MATTAETTNTLTLDYEAGSEWPGCDVFLDLEDGQYIARRIEFAPGIDGDTVDAMLEDLRSHGLSLSGFTPDTDVRWGGDLWRLDRPHGTVTDLRSGEEVTVATWANFPQEQFPAKPTKVVITTQSGTVENVGGDFKVVIPPAPAGAN